MPAPKDLEVLINSRYPLIAVETYEEERVEDMLKALSASLGIPLFLWTVTEGLKRSGLDNSLYDTQQPLKALSNIASMKGEGIYLMKDLHRYLHEVEVVRKLLDLSKLTSWYRRAIILSAPHIDIPPELEKITALLELELPSEQELKVLVRNTLKDLSSRHKFKVDLSQEEFERLAESLKGLTLFEAERAVTRAVFDDLALTGKDLQLIIEIKKEMIGKEGILEYYPREEGMAQVGGLKNLKRWLEKRKKAFTPEAGRFGLDPPKGILLLGVQGCGKSLAAKAIAKEWDLALLKLEPGRLYDKYIGESEKNLEKALGMAERMAPCVLMIDEIEKGFTYVGSSEADAGLSRRIFGRLLGWLQDRKAPAFVAATCNSLQSLPPELTRKGRFDEIFFIDLPTLEERKEIFAIHLKKRKRDPSAFDLNALAAESEGFSGAEIEQATVSALYTAFSRGTEVTTPILLEELKETCPLSVLRQEEIESLREWARGRAVMAS